MLACTSPCKPLPRDTGGVGGPEAGTWRAFPGCSLGTHMLMWGCCNWQFVHTSELGCHCGFVELCVYSVRCELVEGWELGLCLILPNNQPNNDVVVIV